MVFTKRLRDGVRRGRIRCSVRIWKRLHVKVGARYQMDEGHIVVDSIASIDRTDITDDLARESGFNSAADLLETATHGGGNDAYLIRFHYLPPGAWETTPASSPEPKEKATLLQRIRNITSRRVRTEPTNGAAPRSRRR
jgi:hypothetical protein